MKKYELIGLILAISIVLITYSLNTFYQVINKFVTLDILSATENGNNGNNESSFDPLRINTSKKSYFRYEIVDIIADYRDMNKQSIENGTLKAKVYYNNKIIKSVGDIVEFDLQYDEELKKWIGHWPIPWNPPLGTYYVLVSAEPNYPGKPMMRKNSFDVMARPLNKVPPGLSVMAIESGVDITRKKIIGPNGKEGDWRNAIKWANFMGADAIFNLVWIPKTSIKKFLKNESIDVTKLYSLGKIAKECRKNNLLVGAWQMTFFQNSKKVTPNSYKPGLGYSAETGTLYPSYHVSLIDERRIQDLINNVKFLDHDPNVNFIGIDYIRTGRADGYEMAEHVINDMNIKTPSNWETLTSRQRIIWFAKQIEVVKNKATIEKWRWWRAHKVASIVNRIITESGTQKPVWVFTLGWEHGKQHGQDPLMFMDAGVTYDAVMLYEANQMQFRKLLVDWKAYLTSKQANLMVGNSVDVTLLDSNTLTAPEELYRRTIVGAQRISFGGIADGVFWHDLSRSLWGRKGVFPTMEWVVAGGATFSTFKAELGEIPISASIHIPDSASPGIAFNTEIEIANISIEEVQSINVNILKTEGIHLYSKQKRFAIPSLNPGEKKKIKVLLYLKNNTGKSRLKFMIASRITVENHKPVFAFAYISTKSQKVSTKTPDGNKITH